MATLDALLIAISIYSRIKNALDLSTSLDTIQRNKSYSFTDGAGADQADVHWSDERTLGASGFEDLDLNGGGEVVDAFGVSIPFVRIKVIYIEADIGNTNNVVVGGAATFAFLNWVADATDKINVRPGGTLLLIANDATAYAVSGGVSEWLRVGNSGAGTSVKYRIVLVGSLT